MFKTLFLILCAYWAWRLFRRMNAPFAAPRSSSAPRETQQITTELVKDPACNTYIEKSSAVYRDGSYFCSESCAAKIKEKAA